jgi:hypothetical protein
VSLGKNIVRPGQSLVVTYTMIAPAEPGTYETWWVLVHNGIRATGQEARVGLVVVPVQAKPSQSSNGATQHPGASQPPAQQPQPAQPEQNKPTAPAATPVPTATVVPAATSAPQPTSTAMPQSPDQGADNQSEATPSGDEEP